MRQTHIPTRLMFSLALMIMTGLLTLGTATPSFADRDPLRAEIGQFHSFLDRHPRIAAQLQRDPGLVNSSRYLNDHDDLKTFLRRHPRVRREILDHPGYVLGRSYLRYDRSHGPWGRR